MGRRSCSVRVNVSKSRMAGFTERRPGSQEQTDDRMSGSRPLAAEGEQQRGEREQRDHPWLGHRLISYLHVNPLGRTAVRNHLDRNAGYRPGCGLDLADFRIFSTDCEWLVTSKTPQRHCGGCEKYPEKQHFYFNNPEHGGENIISF